MLKNIFTKIENKIFNFSQDEKNIIEDYIKDEIIVKNGEDFEINSKYKIGVLKIEKNFATLEDLVNPIKTNARDLKKALDTVLEYFNEDTKIDDIEFATGSYSPTPTIIEAAISLFNNHSVENITRSDSGATNLRVTTKYVSTLIEYAKQNNKKLICFVTGVPGAGKTLVGLNVAIDHLDKENGDSSVFLSGNAPLVAVLQEALTRDKVLQEKLKGFKLTK